MKLVKEIMTKDLKLARPDISIQTAARVMRDNDLGSLPIGEDDKLVGMITDRDIVTRAIAEAKDPAEVKVGDVMTKNVIYCYEEMNVDEAAKLMMDHKVMRLVVLDSNKRLVGVVSLADIAKNSKEFKLTGEILEEIAEG